ncbi:putative Phox-like protein [Seiridium unicorne]|uniref:Endosomal/vacuolar adapter protein YPT35 n=1 Tax=Seiridium unicorne TaxID=138068 RepID=A0ABR2VBY9_9PEZI
MAPSAIAPQHDGGGNVALGGAIGPRKILPSSNIETPPSPPATETDTETDSDTPPIRPETTRIDTNVPAATDSGTESSSVISPVTSPPYWLHRQSNHARSTSLTSVDSMPTGGITLQDNENSSVDERNNACWAKSVEVTDYVIVNGSATNIGAFVVWNIRVQTLNGSFMNIRKRYSEFDDLRWRLIRTFPNFEAAVPELPPKSLISKFRPRFLEKRRAGLQYFLNCIMLNPEFSGSPVLKEFLFS